MSQPSPSELHSVVREAVEGGDSTSADGPTLAQPLSKQTKYVFAGDVNLHWALGALYESWANLEGYCGGHLPGIHRG